MKGGLLLAFETSGPLGSVCVAEDGRVRARRFLPRQREHGSRLVPAVAEVLEEVGVGVRSLDGVLVGRGPGSFTGVRVAGATARGLVRALGVPLWPLSSLAAGVASAEVELPTGLDLPLALRSGDRRPRGDSDGPERHVGPRLVLFDARGDRGYAALYAVEGHGGLRELRGPESVRIPDLLGDDLPPRTLFCGDGAIRHAELIQDAGFAVAPPPLGVPTAEGLIRLLELLPGVAPVREPLRWTPEYLRPSRARPLPGRKG